MGQDKTKQACEEEQGGMSSGLGLTSFLCMDHDPSHSRAQEGEGKPRAHPNTPALHLGFPEQEKKKKMVTVTD